jgi:hypothetical protein
LYLLQKIFRVLLSGNGTIGDEAKWIRKITTVITGVNLIEAEFNDICLVFCYAVVYISIDTKSVGVVDIGNY